MKALQTEIAKRGIDCALLITYENANPNLFYLTGYSGAGALIVRPQNKPILNVPSRDLTEAGAVKGVEVVSGKKLAETLDSLGVRKIGIDFSNIFASDLNNLKEKVKCEFFDLSDFMIGCRMIKGDEEISKISEACKITDQIIGKFVKNVKKFKTEEEAAAFLVYETYKNGCTLAFEPIVASGKNAAIPHHKPHGKMNKGFCVIDFGVKFEGYCSDVTRTIYIGKITPAEEKIYYDLLENQEKAISFVRSGLEVSELCNHSQKDLKQKLIHSLGHGLGIEVHELPYVSESSKAILKEGMVITIEPGEYVEGKYGIRIEDDVLVTKTGQKVLSKFTKKLIIVK